MGTLALNDRIAEPVVATAGITDLACDFPVLDPTEIRVDRHRGTVITTLFPGEDFIVINDDGADFTAQLLEPALDGDIYIPYSLTLPKRERAHTPGGATRTPTLEGDAMQFEAQLQEASRDLARVPRLPMGDAMATLPHRLLRRNTVWSFDADGDLFLEPREDFAEGDGEPAPPATAGNGVVRFSFNPAEPTKSLAHLDGLPDVGDYVRTGWATSTRQSNSGGGWEVLNHTAGVPTLPSFNAALLNTSPAYRRIFMQGAGGLLGLVDDAYLDLAQLGLRSDNTVSTQGQEAIFVTARDYALYRFADDIQAVITPAIGFHGIVWTAVGDIDMKKVSFVAGPAGKIIAKNGIKDGDGNDIPRAIIKFGAGTSPQNRFSIASVVDVYVEGNQSSTLDNLTTRVVGVDLYDDTSSVSSFQSRASRCYIGTRIRNNSEKRRLKVAGVYNSILCDYVQLRVNMAAYKTASGATDAEVADLAEYLMLEDGGPSGYKGEWNPELNQQGLATGTAVGQRGAWYKVTQSFITAVAIDGRTSWTSGRWLVSDGEFWFQIADNNLTPDTNEIELTGQNNEVIFRVSDGIDGSGVVAILHESRIYKGGTIQAYTSLTESLTVPTPAIIDRGGKWMLYRGHCRAGDQLVFGFTGKDKGTDTTGFDLTTNHIYGTHWWFEDAAKIFGTQTFEDSGNGRNPSLALTDVPCPVVRINKVADAGGYRLNIFKSKNTWGVVIGDEGRRKYSTDLNLPHIAVTMGNVGTIATSDPSPNTYIAIEVRMVNGLHMVSPQLRGQLNYLKDAKRVHHVVPAAYVRARDTVNAAAGSSVTIEVAGDLTATEAFGIAWPARIKVLATIDGMRMSRVNGKWRPDGAVQMLVIDRDCENSDHNRYLDVGTEGYLTDVEEPIWLQADGKWRDIAGTLYTPEIMPETQDILDRWTGLAVDLPVGDDLAKLDRAVYRMVKGGIFAKGRVLIPLRWNSVETDAIVWAGSNLFANNCSDPAGHPYDVTLPAPNWTPGEGLLGDGVSYRLPSGFNVLGTPAGAWDPEEGTVTGGEFWATIFASSYDNGLLEDPENGYEWVSDNAKAGIKARAFSGASARMNGGGRTAFTATASGMPHLMGALRNGSTDDDLYNLDNGAVDSVASDTPTYAAEQAASIGLPDQFYILGGKTNLDASVNYCDRTTGLVAIFIVLDFDEIALFADIEREWGTTDGFYA